jgi:hypothetical protein
VHQFNAINEILFYDVGKRSVTELALGIASIIGKANNRVYDTQLFVIGGTRTTPIRLCFEEITSLSEKAVRKL